MHVSRVSAALLGVTALSIAVSAQTPALLFVSYTTVKPERVREYIDINKQYSDGFKKAGVPFRYVYRNAAGNPYEFLVVTPMSNYAALDSPGPLTKGMSEGDLARLADRRAQCVLSVRTSYDRPLAELSIGTNTAPKIVRATRVRVRPGMADQWIAMMTEQTVPALKKGGVTWYRVRRVEYGGSRNDFVMGTGAETMAELDAPSALIKALGQEGYKKWADKANSLGTAIDWSLYRFMPEVSYRLEQ